MQTLFQRFCINSVSDKLIDRNRSDNNGNLIKKKKTKNNKKHATRLSSQPDFQM